MKRWVAILPLGVLVALGAVFATFGLHHDPHFIPDATVGQSAPDETLPRLDTGRLIALKGEFQGPTLVTFFASWCVPCIQEAPALLALRAEGVRIIGVSYKDDPNASRDFLARNGDPFNTVVIDRNGRAGIDFGVDGVPDTFLIGADGVILAKHSGPIEPADATRLLDRIPQRRRAAL